MGYSIWIWIITQGLSWQLYERAKLFLLCAGRLAYPIHANSSAQHKVEQDFFEAGKTSFRMDGRVMGWATDTMGGKGRKAKKGE